MRLRFLSLLSAITTTTTQTTKDDRNLSGISHKSERTRENKLLILIRISSQKYAKKIYNHKKTTTRYSTKNTSFKHKNDKKLRILS